MVDVVTNTDELSVSSFLIWQVDSGVIWLESLLSIATRILPTKITASDCDSDLLAVKRAAQRVHRAWARFDVGRISLLMRHQQHLSVVPDSITGTVCSVVDCNVPRHVDG